MADLPLPAVPPSDTPSESALRRSLRRARDGATLDVAEAAVLLAARGEHLDELLGIAGRVRDAGLVAEAVAEGLRIRGAAPSGWRDSMAIPPLRYYEPGTGLAPDGRLDPRSVAERIAALLPADQPPVGPSVVVRLADHRHALQLATLFAEVDAGTSRLAPVPRDYWHGPPHQQLLAAGLLLALAFGVAILLLAAASV